MDHVHEALDHITDELSARAMARVRNYFMAPSTGERLMVDMAISTLVVASVRLADQHDAWEQVELRLREMHQSVLGRLANIQAGKI